MIGDIRSRINASTKALEEVSAALGPAVGSLEEAIGILSSTIEGTGNDKVKESLAQFVEAKEKLDDAFGLVASGRGVVEDFEKTL